MEIDSISSPTRPAQPSSGEIASGTVLDCTPELPDCTPVHQEHTTTSTAAIPATQRDVHTSRTDTFTGLDIFSKMMARRGDDSIHPSTDRSRRRRNININTNTNIKKKTIPCKLQKPGPLDRLWGKPVSQKRKLNITETESSNPRAGIKTARTQNFHTHSLSTVTGTDFGLINNLNRRKAKFSTNVHPDNYTHTTTGGVTEISAQLHSSGPGGETKYNVGT